MIFVTAIALCYLAMLCFCMAMQRHFRQFWQREPEPFEQLALRVLGIALLIPAWIACGLGWNWPMATIAWFMLLALTGYSLLLSLPYHTRPALGAAAIAIPCSMVGWFL